MNIQKKYRELLSKWISVLIIGVCAIVLLIRNFYSFSWSDESSYLTLVHRFWLGERMIADEWFKTQLIAPLLLPFYGLYQWITGGNDGIYLYFRLLYWGISVFTSFFTYCKLQKKNCRMASLICSLTYLFYSRANIGGMSYYNVTLTCVLLSALLLYEQLGQKKVNKIKLYVMGLLLAFAVVGNPFLAFPYVVICIYMLARKKYRIFWHEILTVIAGTGTIAVFYMGYLLNKISIDDLLLNIPYILNEPEMQRTNPIFVIPLIIARIAWKYKWTIAITFLLVCYILWAKIKKKGFSDRENKLLMAINLGVFIINSILSINILGCINIAIVLFVLPMVVMYNDWRDIDHAVVEIFGIAGFCLVLGFSFSSNTGLDAMAIGFVVLGIGAVLLAFQLDVLKKNQLLYGTTILVFSVVVFQTAILRLYSVYRDAPINQLDTQITSGPAKYLYTTQEHVRQYNELKAAINQYVRSDDVVFYSKWCFWSYLCTNNGYGTPSSWRMPFDSPRLQEYYEINPDKIPTCIFVLSPEYGDFESSIILNNEKALYPNENNVEGYLYDYIQEHEYEKIELQCAIIYRKRL